MKVKITDVAEKAGVSIATVSHVINETRFVSDTTKSKVLQAIDELGYTPDQHARSFKMGKRNLIGFIVPDISNSYFSTIIEEVEKVLTKNQYNLVIANTNETKKRELDHIRSLTSGIVDGLILASTFEDYDDIASSIPPNFPLLLIDRTLSNSSCDTVAVSSFDAVYTAVNELILKGHTNIGYIAGLSRLSTTKERLDAYKKALSDNDINIDEELIQFGNSMHDCAFTCMRNLLEKNCSAIVISNHIMAIDSIKYLSMQNIEVNQDLTIVAFDDYGWNSLMSNNFDKIIQPVQNFGKIVGDTMLDRLLHPQAPNKQLILYSIYQPKIQL